MSTWRPSASIEMLRLRAKVLQQIRQFFATKNVMEVETPLLGSTSVTDPFIQSIPAYLHKEPHYLQTSPEYAMKRLLAAGAGDIYQISKAFRHDEQGSKHNPEFTILEWYRIDYDHHQLMNEMDELLQLVLQTSAAERLSYQDLFLNYLNINPHTISLSELESLAQQLNIVVESNIPDVDTWLQILLSHCIEPHIGKDVPCFIYDFPASQSALARIRDENPAVSSRFEVYFRGLELANGFHELQIADEQRKRFENNMKQRQKLNVTTMAIDENFLAALGHGLPNCSGVALGIDRLIMMVADQTHIAAVLSFDFARV